MSELRRDPLTDRWVIIAENRAQRPQDFQVHRQVRSSEQCAFCEGHENDTPPAALTRRSIDGTSDGPGWQIRVFPNKYPALTPDTNPPDEDRLPPSVPGLEDMFCGHIATGVHEVIVESPEHVERTTEVSKQHLGEVVRVYRDRLLALRSDPSIRFGIVFKNVGQKRERLWYTRTAS